MTGEFHWRASPDIRMIPLFPTVTKKPWPKVTDRRSSTTALCHACQVLKLVEVRSTPLSPTITTGPVGEAIEISSKSTFFSRGAESVIDCVSQLTPSPDIKVISSPTILKSPLRDATDFK